MCQTEKDNWDKAKIIFQIVAIISIIIYGHIINSSLKEREMDLKIVQVAVDILRTEPNDNTVILREWAIEIVNNLSGVPLNEQVKQELLNKQLPATSNIVTMGGEPVTMGGKTVTFGNKSVSH